MEEVCLDGDLPSLPMGGYGAWYRGYVGIESEYTVVVSGTLSPGTTGNGNSLRVIAVSCRESAVASFLWVSSK